MSLEALSSNEFFNLLINDDSVSAPLATTNLLFNSTGLSLLGGFNGDTGSGSSGGGNGGGASFSSMMMMHGEFSTPVNGGDVKPGQSRRKRRRRTRSCKNKEEAENQRMTHIAVERNRRRQMNEHLSVLRSLMPESYVQRGDQASIVGGAIDFVKELEQLLQSLEAQKRTLIQQQQDHHHHHHQKVVGDHDTEDVPPFSQFFAYPQYIWCHSDRECQPESHRAPAMADIEVTLIETHANLRILSPRRPRQLLKLVVGLQALSLTILHLNVTTLDSLVLYSLSTKVEEGCNLTTVDEIAAVVHHMLTLIEAETQSNGPAQESPVL
ncbi:Myc-type basic helix-loop-helix (bHLH) domain-containing protein [Dioscorea alata]|uniref:Myc-type basic helix-loop-helix (BHLH) domain-containing protein n=1 Tax=Dioscorea alata TaxID=55571 RepID=A0ACB7WH27_DIOAL|nr:Myc-type basic helix-loop-helix (bHLH) domain-containing protein [Dioscorea alata]